MKNIFKIKNLVFAVLLCITGSYSVSAQCGYYGRNDFKTECGNVGVGSKAFLYFANENQNKKIALWDNTGNNNNFYGFGLSDYTLRYQVSDIRGNHVFYAGAWNTNNDSSNELMRIMGNGNVGIGTATPSDKLQVNGTGRFSGLKVEGNARFANNSSGINWGSTDLINGFYSRIMDDGQLRILTDDVFSLGKLNVDGTSGSTTLYANVDNGRVGIGTITPSDMIHVNGTGRFSGLKVEGNARFANNSSGINWGSTDLINGFYSRIMDDGNLQILTDDNFYLGKLNGAGTNGGTTLFANVNTGNVGIGTLTPNAPLQFSNDVVNRKIVLYQGRSDINNHEFYGFGVNSNTLRYQVDELNSSHVFYAGNSANLSNELMRIKGDGRVAIGRDVKVGVQLALNGSFNVASLAPTAVATNGAFQDSDYSTIFHVSTGINKVFVGKDAYVKYQASETSTSGTIKASDYSLWVSQGVNATDFALSDISTWNDFVFAKEYKLPTLLETEDYITKNKHLPYIPSEVDVIKNGYSIHNINRGFLQTIEELTLHAIAQEKEINAMKSELADIKALLLAKK